MEDLKSDKKLDYVGKPDFARALVKKDIFKRQKKLLKKASI